MNSSIAMFYFIITLSWLIISGRSMNLVLVSLIHKIWRDEIKRVKKELGNAAIGSTILVTK